MAHPAPPCHKLSSHPVTSLWAWCYKWITCNILTVSKCLWKSLRGQVLCTQNTTAVHQRRRKRRGNGDTRPTMMKPRRRTYLITPAVICHVYQLVDSQNFYESLFTLFRSNSRTAGELTWRTQNAPKLLALGLHPGPYWGSLQCSPRAPSWWGGEPHPWLSSSALELQVSPHLHNVDFIPTPL